MKIGDFVKRGVRVSSPATQTFHSSPLSSAAVAVLVGIPCSSLPSATLSSLDSASDVDPFWSSYSRSFPSHLTTRFISPSLFPSLSLSPSPPDSSDMSSLWLRALSYLYLIPSISSLVPYIINTNYHNSPFSIYISSQNISSP